MPTHTSVMMPFLLHSDWCGLLPSGESDVMILCCATMSEQMPQCLSNKKLTIAMFSFAICMRASAQQLLEQLMAAGICTCMLLPCRGPQHCSCACQLCGCWSGHNRVYTIYVFTYFEFVIPILDCWSYLIRITATVTSNHPRVKTCQHTHLWWCHSCCTAIDVVFSLPGSQT